MVKAEDKARRIYMLYVRTFDPMYGILIKKTVHEKAIKASIGHCIQMIDELQLIITQLAPKPAGVDCYHSEYPAKRLQLYQDIKKHLETMIKSAAK